VIERECLRARGADWRIVASPVVEDALLLLMPDGWMQKC
jgi:hypothetical protein